MAERINELEKQQQQQQVPNKFTYFDPEKKHKVADNSLRAIQKRALLSFYERHQPGSAWRSEPQLSPPPRPPPIPSRPRLPTPQSRRSSISSEYDTPATWNDVSIFRTPVPRMPVASSVKYSHGFLIKHFFFHRIVRKTTVQPTMSPVPIAPRNSIKINIEGIST